MAQHAGMAQWREGVDTCVFKPAVRCVGEEDRREGVSRVRTTDAGARDTLIETRIRDAFPKLVERGVVSVYSHMCVPEYDEEDANDEVPEDRRSSGCEKLGEIEPGPNPDHQNFITPRLRGTLNDLLLPNGVENYPRIRNWKQLLRNATWAAVELVPDAGPWIIHTDCHLGNVLYKVGEGGRMSTAIGDWGRVILIEKPNDIESVRMGIREWIGSLAYLQTPADAPAGKIIDVINHMSNRDQHPRRILNHVRTLMTDSPDTREADLAAVRGWLLYVLIRQVTDLLPADERIAIPYNILLARDQDALKAYRETILQLRRPAPVPVAEVEPMRLDTRREDLGAALRRVAVEGIRRTPALPVPERRAIAAGEGPPPVVVADGPREGGAYWPAKYFKGLTRKQNAQRKRSATRRTKMSSKDPKAYVPFKSDKGQKTRKSSYTERFHKKYPGVTSLPDIAKATGVSKKVLQTVYDRGMAAWRTGHRPGASQQAWGMARVYSFVLHGKTYRTADKDLAGKT